LGRSAAFGRYEGRSHALPPILVQRLGIGELRIVSPHLAQQRTFCPVSDGARKVEWAEC